MWAESRRRIVCDTIIRIVVRVVAWLFMGIIEHGGRGVRSCIMRSVVIAITSPFMREKLVRERGAGSRDFISNFWNFDDHGEADVLPWIINVWTFIKYWR
jgi:hypothetical protein